MEYRVLEERVSVFPVFVWHPYLGPLQSDLTLKEGCGC